MAENGHAEKENDLEPKGRILAHTKNYLFMSSKECYRKSCMKKNIKSATRREYHQLWAYTEMLEPRFYWMD